MSIFYSVVFSSFLYIHPLWFFVWDYFLMCASMPTKQVMFLKLHSQPCLIWVCENATFPARDAGESLQSKEKSNGLDTGKTALCTLKDVREICMLMWYTANVCNGLKPLQQRFGQRWGKLGRSAHGKRDIIYRIMTFCLAGMFKEWWQKCH